MEDIKAKLIQVGLTDKEAAVYIALLATGKTTAYNLAKKAGLKISTSYVVLESLREKDLVSKIPDSKRQLFLATDPTYFFERLNSNVHALETVLPKLQSLSRRKEESSVLVYEGYAGIKDALEYKFSAMRGKTFKGLYSSLPDPDEKLLRVMTRWSDKCVKAGVDTQVIAPDTADSKRWVQDTLEKYTKGLKLIPEKLWSPEISIEVGDGFVRIIDTKELQAVVVDNPKVAMALEQLFAIVWDGVEGNEVTS